MSDISLYLYGSAARGDTTDSSDIDILVVCPTAVNEPDIEIGKRANSLLESASKDYSYYSIERLKEMFNSGHLFAWHLYREAEYLTGKHDYVSELGCPNPYDSFDSDVLPLFDIFTNIPDCTKACKLNAVYEAGLGYVCLRNIAMAASYFLNKEVTFSSYAPFLLDLLSDSLPFSIDEYEMLKQARLAGTRGLTAPIIEPLFLENVVGNSIPWVKKVMETVARGSR